jgi:hypothetical protein
MYEDPIPELPLLASSKFLALPPAQKKIKTKQLDTSKYTRSDTAIGFQNFYHEAV